MSEQQLIADGTVVTMHYTLTNTEGEVIDSSRGREPMAYLHGANNIVPGLERELEGKSVGAKVDAVVAPKDGYGEPQGPGPQPVPRTAFPADAPLAPGMQVLAKGPDGSSFPLWIVAVGDAEVQVDTNHPLAGVTLHFVVEITGVRDASAEELAHGHPHGPGGAQHN